MDIMQLVIHIYINKYVARDGDFDIIEDDRQIISKINIFKLTEL